MYYITVKQSPRYKQMTLEDFLYGPDSIPREVSLSTSNTRTYRVEKIGSEMKDKVASHTLIDRLAVFNSKYQNLRKQNMHSLYSEFFIPKKSGGLRKIDAPKAELMNALRELKLIFETDFHALYHTSAFAYIQNRSTIDCVKRHQINESKWFAKFDLSNFFGSTTIEFVMEMLACIYPFCEVIEDQRGNQELRDALSLAFLDGGLPQGTPLSPLITNIMMIPIDFELFNSLRNYERQQYVYTRYADDFHISSKYDFDYREIERMVQKTLAKFHAPFRLNEAKTRYGSSAGRNWMLGVMLNKDNTITIGRKNKKHFENMLKHYIMDSNAGIIWELNDVQVMEGLRNYYRMVEGETIDRIVEHINRKFGVNVVRMIKEQLRA